MMAQNDHDYEGGQRDKGYQRRISNSQPDTIRSAWRVAGGYTRSFPVERCGRLQCSEDHDYEGGQKADREMLAA